jgi:peptide-methionine (S)-S-oxide reductase
MAIHRNAPLQLACLALVTFVAFAGSGPATAQLMPADKTVTHTQPPKETLRKKMELATFGGGCFWCTEAVFLELEGVEKVVSGYSGGYVENPTYTQVCTGTTGHAEVIQIEYDPEKVSFEELLEVHFKTHDPTSLNQQGNDVGPQYRSAVFYHTPEQKETTERIIKALNDEKAYRRPIVTEVTELTKFWPAEDYHQNYFALNGNANPYCAAVVQPKVEKFRKVFKDKLKKEEVAK